MKEDINRSAAAPPTAASSDAIDDAALKRPGCEVEGSAMAEVAGDDAVGICVNDFCAERLDSAYTTVASTTEERKSDVCAVEAGRIASAAIGESATTGEVDGRVRHGRGVDRTDDAGIIGIVGCLEFPLATFASVDSLSERACSALASSSA